jgi:hypothetical protein
MSLDISGGSQAASANGSLRLSAAPKRLHRADSDPEGLPVPLGTRVLPHYVAGDRALQVGAVTAKRT